MSSIMIHSSGPLDNGAYAQQTGMLARALAKAGHTITLSSYWNLKGSPQGWEGIPVLPGFEGDEYGTLSLPAHVDRIRPDLVIMIVDPWAIEPAAVYMLPVQVAVWTPVDAEWADGEGRIAGGLLYQRWFAVASNAVPIAVTRFGEAQLTALGLEPLYVPYMADTDIFAPPAYRDGIRAAMNMGDRFGVAIVAANQDQYRKGWDPMFQAFAGLLDHDPDAVLMIHSAKSPTRRQRDGTMVGIELPLLARACGIEKNIAWSDQYAYKCGLPAPSDVARFYAGADVLLSCSLGGSFELPIIEAQACGTPVISPGYLGMAELNFDGWKIPGRRRWDPNRAAWWYEPDIDEIEGALIAAREMDGDERSRRARGGRAFALQYDTRTVMREYWLPALEKLEKQRA